MMDFNEYQESVERTATKDRDLSAEQAIAAVDFLYLTASVCSIGEALKKHYYHDRVFERSTFQDTLEFIEHWAKKLKNGAPGDAEGHLIKDGPEKDIMFSILGLIGEVGELITPILQMISFGGKLHLYSHSISDEMGDAHFYLADMATAIDEHLNRIVADNVKKLEERYPDGYSHEAAKGKADQKTTTWD